MFVILEEIITFIVILYVIRFIGGFLLRLFVNNVMNNVNDQFQKQQSQQPQDKNQSNSSKSDKPRETKKVGEYIDYEEVD